MHARPLPVEAPVADLVGHLARALDGTGPALLPVSGTPHPALVEAARLDRPVADGTALLLPTSGTTGPPKVVELSADALLASARATHARLGPPGRWLLALPLTHVAGWQVLVRSLMSATPVPVTLPPGQPFSADAFHAALRAHPELRFASLVPTQLTRLVEDDPAELRRLTILLGGAAAPEALLRRAEEAGLRVVTTYGASETSGGCVYDGRPLDGVTATIRPDGRLALAGPTLATGYRGRPDDPAFTLDGTGIRWFVTNDLADLDDGRVRILGRADDVVITGGEKVHPAEVERVLTSLPGIREAVVVGVPDGEWGQRVVAVVTCDASDPGGWRRAADGLLPGYAWPRRFVQVDRIPLLGIGKPDRQQARRLAQAELAADREVG